MQRLSTSSRTPLPAILTAFIRVGNLVILRRCVLPTASGERQPKPAQLHTNVPGGTPCMHQRIGQLLVCRGTRPVCMYGNLGPVVAACSVRCCWLYYRAGCATPLSTHTTEVTAVRQSHLVLTMCTRQQRSCIQKVQNCCEHRLQVATCGKSWYRTVRNMCVQRGRLLLTGVVECCDSNYMFPTLHHGNRRVSAPTHCYTVV